MPRQRTVHPSRQVVSLWVAGQLSMARNAKRTIYFHGNTIYSYGEHFPIATIIEYAHPKKIVAFATSRRYSVTTSKHQHLVRCELAMAGAEVHYVDDVIAAASNYASIH